MRRATSRLPAWAQTIRFRLAFTYTLLLLAGMILVVAGIYSGFAATVDSDPVAAAVKKTGYLVKENGNVLKITSTEQLTEFEEAVNVQTLATLRDYSVASLAALPLLSAGLGWWLSGRALRPVHEIVAVAGEIEATDLSRRIDLTGPQDELRELADTFDRMLARLDAAFLAHRSFVDDASHDLRNPLAIARTNLDVVRRDPDATVEDYRRATTIAVRGIDRMSGIVDGLVAMARQTATAAAHGDVDLDDLLLDVAEEHRAAAAVRSLVLDVRRSQDVTVAGERDALRRAVANLLDNAVRLAPELSTITLASGRRDDWRWVAVRDEGPGIAPADRERVFDRNWGAEEPGHRGLGLAIVAQVARAHGGLARVHGDGPGSTFVVWTRSSSRTSAPAPTANPLR